MDKRVVTEMLDCSNRCDRCSSQAYVLAVLDLTPAQQAAGQGDELYLCRHHWLQHEAALEPLCGLIVDETHRLFEHIEPPEATELNSIKK
ncbi:DUF7455 domain-containing protein [Paenarthrobacter ureafaciens]|uniref:DUF7455 domain-containing protein n=1 Tax=Paenarthrobacter ureafaciens TaxID=37931 RepID=UPI00140DABFA|nr:hypothetical protein [Paenarthrobacter ureafaciens]MCX8455339.1 hypothetical protein [Paenarthrobacter ureafaciens]MCY0974066.1 hypothetical protein [Paenarthrobacter ureafaciens]